VIEGKICPQGSEVLEVFLRFNEGLLEGISNMLQTWLKARSARGAGGASARAVTEDMAIQPMARQPSA
jgi:hypothetical protein